MSTGPEQHENALAHSNNPYLLQHASNPVKWRMWEAGTFDEARDAEKPLFISIGYSTCHWCHVMARESFEDEDAAELINRIFIPVKVDREERPDIDAFYMDVALKLNGSGGWPLTVFSTPEGYPFFTATYIPKNGYGRRAGLMQLLPEIERLWNEERKRVLDSANSIVQAVKQRSGSPSVSVSAAGGDSTGAEDLPDAGVSQVYDSLAASYDSERGGFGGAPKFPQPHLLRFLLEYGDLAGKREDALAMAEHTLRSMRAGGIYDHIGFGFHRYATDAEWKVPHFEKMLYDQALLIPVFLDAYQATADERYAATAREIITFAERELKSPEGAYCSALDAESGGEEGGSYLWTRRELLDFLGAGGEQAADFFHVYENGNWTDPVSGKKQKTNILFEDYGASASRDIQEWEKTREQLYGLRSRREQPSTDDKILTSWNGLMIKALARAERVLGDQAYAEAARETARFITDRMLDENGELLHSYRRGTASVHGHIEDYAFFVSALIELYEADYDPAHLQTAVSLTERALELFEDHEKGGFFFDSGRETHIPVRSKVLYDGAMPSGSSVTAENLALLFRLTGNTRFRDSLLRMASAHRQEIEAAPVGCSLVLSSLEMVLGGTAPGNETGVPQESAPGSEIVIAGEGEEAQRMISVLRERFLPRTLVLWKHGEKAEELAEIAPYTGDYRADPRTGAAAYVCTDFTCRRPVGTADELARLLQ